MGHALLLHVVQEARGLEAGEQADGRAAAQRRHDLHARGVRDRPHQPQQVAGAQALAAREELAQLGQPVAEGLHRGLEHAAGARGVVQHRQFVGAHALAGEGVARECQLAFVGSRRALGRVEQQQLRGCALQERQEGLGARGGGDDQRGVAVLDDLGHLDRCEPRVHRRLHQRGLVAGQLQLDDLDAVGQVHAHAVAALQAEPAQGIGQAVGAPVELFVGAGALRAGHGDLPRMQAGGAGCEFADVGDLGRK
ncbi:hypothetical protein D3C72_1383550 [compost metagenome]